MSSVLTNSYCEGEDVYLTIMSTSNKRTTRRQNELINNIEGFLQEMIELLEPDKQEKVGRGRPRVMPVMCLWAGLLVCVLRGTGSQLTIWRQLAVTLLGDYPRFPITDQAVYKRLEQGGTDDLERLFRQVSSVMGTRLEPYAQHEVAPFATEVVAIDTTTLNPVARKLPVLRDVSKGGRRVMPVVRRMRAQMQGQET